MLIPAATVLSQPRESSFYLGGQPGKAPPLTALIGLFIFWCWCCFGCLATQWWRLPVPRGAINEWAEIFMLGAVAIARAEHCRICNSTCPECAFPIMLREKSNGEYLVGEEREEEFAFRKWQTSLCTVPYSQSYLPTGGDPITKIASVHFSITSTHSSVLAWRTPGTGEPGGLPSLGSHRVGHDWSDLAAAAAVKGLLLLSFIYKTLLFPACKCTSQVMNKRTGHINWLSQSPCCALLYFVTMITLQNR